MAYLTTVGDVSLKDMIMAGESDNFVIIMTLNTNPAHWLIIVNIINIYKWTNKATNQLLMKGTNVAGYIVR